MGYRGRQIASKHSIYRPDRRLVQEYPIRNLTAVSGIEFYPVVDTYQGVKNWFKQQDRISDADGERECSDKMH